MGLKPQGFRPFLFLSARLAAGPAEPRAGTPPLPSRPSRPSPTREHRSVGVGLSAAGGRIRLSEAAVPARLHTPAPPRFALPLPSPRGTAPSCGGAHPRPRAPPPRGDVPCAPTVAVREAGRDGLHRLPRTRHHARKRSVGVLPFRRRWEEPHCSRVGVLARRLVVTAPHRRPYVPRIARNDAEFEEGPSGAEKGARPRSGEAA